MYSILLAMGPYWAEFAQHLAALWLLSALAQKQNRGVSW